MLIFLIRLYQKLISPMLPPHTCRFYPTCSCYAVEAIGRYGNIKGLFLFLKRLARCHPFCSGGYDPIP